MYDIPCLRHMTSYMTCFCQIMMDKHHILYSEVLGPTWVKKGKLCSDWGYDIDVMAVYYGRFMAPLWVNGYFWDFKRIIS